MGFNKSNEEVQNKIIWSLWKRGKLPTCPETGMQSNEWYMLNVPSRQRLSHITIWDIINLFRNDRLINLAIMNKNKGARRPGPHILILLQVCTVMSISFLLRAAGYEIPEQFCVIKSFYFGHFFLPPPHPFSSFFSKCYNPSCNRDWYCVRILVRVLFP